MFIAVTLLFAAVALALGAESTRASVSTEACPSAARLSAADPSTVSLLQTGHVEHLNRASLVPRPSNNVQRINAAPTAAARLELLKPVVWLHIEKCGSSFQNLLEQFTELWEGCAWGEKAAAAEENGFSIFDSVGTMKTIMADCPTTVGSLCALEDQCAVTATVDETSSFTYSSTCRHAGMDLLYTVNQGHTVSMFRQPEQRIMSGFYNDFHSYDSTLPEPTALVYAQYIQGCQTKMLARHMDLDTPITVCANGDAPTEQETALAVTRLQEGIAFVGITDEWDLSVCLFHAKFGGACKATDFVNSRPGTNSTASLYDTSALQGFVDVSDHVVFKEVQRLFAADLARFGVTATSCEATCWSQV
jgi:hypothetical protein